MTHPVIEAVVSKLDANLREAWEERAAILQFDAGADRDLSEALAVVMVLQQFPDAVHSCLTNDGARDLASYVKR